MFVFYSQSWWLHFIELLNSFSANYLTASCNAMVLLGSSAA